MSNTPCYAARELSNHFMDNDKKTRVILEPMLESKVSCWSSCQRRELARKFERWARQLRVSAKMLDLDEGPKPAPHLKALTPRHQRLN